SSTWSRLSALRSSTKEVSRVILEASAPSCSATILITLLSISCSVTGASPWKASLRPPPAQWYGEEKILYRRPGCAKLAGSVGLGLPARGRTGAGGSTGAGLHEAQPGWLILRIR